MNIPALHTPAFNSNVRSLPAHAFHSDVEPLSRADSGRADYRRADNRTDPSLLTMSYPQRIKMMIARAPAPPPLRRTPQAASAPMSEETRAMLLFVHTSHATESSCTSVQH